MRKLLMNVVLLSILFFLKISVSSDKNIKSSPVRAFHFVLRAVPLDKAYWMIDEAKKAGFNTIVVQITDGVKLENSPWTPRKDAWTKEEFKTWIEYTKNKSMHIVPEFQFLTHQEKFFQGNYPEYMYNSKTYDPRKEEVYKKVFLLIDEVIKIINPKAIHIGHDEVAGFSKEAKWLKPGEEVLPAKLFYEDIMRLYNYLKNKGLDTWIWGDMLISPDEFPELPETFKRSCHGNLSGYGKEIREKLPKEIVICDWHYKNEQEEFPSLTVFQGEGFRVIGTTWVEENVIKNFSKYASKHKAYGMMATTWWHVQKRQWDIVQKIIEISGKTFLKDFPDAGEE